MTLPRPSRRTVLCGAATALSAVAGCVSGGESGDAQPAEQNGTVTTGPAETERSTAGPTRRTSTTDSVTGTEGTGTESTGTESAGAEPAGTERGRTLVYASTETTPTGIDLAGNPILGDPDAPVDMYYWSDFQCPFCNRFEQNAAPKLVENEISEGRLRTVFLELPNVGSDSRIAALVAKCVWRQVKDARPDAYHRWHATVYDEQEQPDSGWASREQLLALTESVDGVDADAVDSCLESHREAVAASVEADVEQAGSHGVSVTPGFVLCERDSGETRTLTGAQPYDRFQAEIEAIGGQ